MHVSNAGTHRTRGEAFVGYLMWLRDRAGIGTNVELAERVRQSGSPDFNPSIISKWKTGVTDPSVESLRAIAHALNVSPMSLYLRAGIILPEDMDEGSTPEVYSKLIELDRVMQAHDLEVVRDEELRGLRRHVEVLIDNTIGYIQRRQEDAGQPTKIRRRRRAS